MNDESTTIPYHLHQQPQDDGHHSALLSGHDQHDTAVSLPPSEPSAPISATSATATATATATTSIVPVLPPSSTSTSSRRDSIIWMRRASRAVDAHAMRREKELKRWAWHPLTLAFPDRIAEKAFSWYFSTIRERRMRRGLLLLAGAYMIYATIEWGDSAASWHLLISRGIYLFIHLCMFTFAFVRPIIYRRWVQEIVALLTLYTGVNIIIESTLLRSVYSPFVVIIILCYLVASNVFVRLRFIHTIGVGWCVLILYDIICLLAFSDGDSTLTRDGNNVLRYLAWYNAILIFIILTVMKLSHRIEVGQRYEFLTNYRLSKIKQRRIMSGEQEAAITDPNLAAPHLTRTNSEFLDQYVWGPHTSHPTKTSIDLQPPSVIIDGTTPLLSDQHPHPHPHLHPHDDEKFTTRDNTIYPTHIEPHARTVAMARDDADDIPDDEDDDWADLDADPDLEYDRRVTMALEKAAAARRTQRIESELDADTTTRTNDPISAISEALARSGAGNLRDFINYLAAREVVEHPLQKIQPHLVSADQLPPYFAPYAHILTGYRCNYSYHLCMKSAFHIHNETCNVWTEFIPAIAFFFYFFWYMWFDDTIMAASRTDRTMVGIGFMISMVVRPLCSGFAHLFYCVSQRAYVLWWGIDYASICVCVLSVSLVFGRFTFMCLPDQQTFYYISLGGLFLSTIICVVFVSSAGVRTGSFVLFVTFANAVPFIYQFTLKLAGARENNVPQDYILLWTLQTAIAILAFLFKSSSIPERFKPGMFDIWLHSHSIWHICINASSAVALFAWREYLRWRMEETCG